LGDHADNHPEGSGFSRTVSSEQSDDTSARNGYRDFVDDGPAGVFLHQPTGFKKSSFYQNSTSDY